MSELITDKQIKRFVDAMYINPYSTGSIDRHIREIVQRLESAEDALKDLLPEVYCLYDQAGNGRLDKKPKDSDVVKKKYDKARQHFDRVRGDSEAN